MFTDWTDICKNTKANIHGVSLKPSYCQSKVSVQQKQKKIDCQTFLTFFQKWPFGGVEGHWLVDFDEEDCTPHWGELVDKVNISLKPAETI
jgi:hypothetical protein